MQLTSLQVKNFRCFSEKTIEFDHHLIHLQGLNGSGKTSVIEAIHYLCYLRSFRTHTPRELLYFGHENFFLKAMVAGSDENSHEIQVGFSAKKRIVKINQHAITSYKDLMDHYRVVTLTEDDGQIIKAGPDARRTFIDQALLLADQSYGQQIRLLKHLVDTRNALLQDSNYNKQSFEIWTYKLWQHTSIIRQARIALLTLLEHEVIRVLATIDPSLQISFSYLPKHLDPTVNFDEFTSSAYKMFSDEIRYKRSLFGAHLDDFSVLLQNKFTKQFASRGQQKLIILLIKMAQVTLLMADKGPVIFLLDDFITDFDDRRAEQLLPPLLALGGQLIFTSPSTSGSLHEALSARGSKNIALTD